MSVTFAMPFMLAILWQGGSCQNSTMRNRSTAKIETVSTGVWGGQHIRMQVTERGASIEYDCAHGTIEERLVIDSSDRFEVKGMHVKERGGPVREGEASEGESARYAGHINGQTMTLTVTLTHTNENIGTFTLAYGKAPRLMKCL
jgi:hypothetical protein